MSSARLLTLVAGMLLVCSGQEYTVREGEIIRNLLPADNHILVGSSNAIYRIDADSLTEVQRHALSSPNRLLVTDNGGTYDSQVLTCDNDNCFLSEITNFLNMSWRVPRSEVFRTGVNNVEGIFTPSISGRSELLFGESANGDFARRFLRGKIDNVNLMGPNPPVNSDFMAVAERRELTNDEVYRYYSYFLHNGFIYYVTDPVVGEKDPRPVGRVVRFCQNDSVSRASFESLFELRLGCSSNAIITAAKFINTEPFTQPTIVVTSRGENNEMHMCSYNLERIDQLMMGKYLDCINGNGLLGFERDELAMETRTCDEASLGNPVSLIT